MPQPVPFHTIQLFWVTGLPDHADRLGHGWPSAIMAPPIENGWHIVVPDNQLSIVQGTWNRQKSLSQTAWDALLLPNASFWPRTLPFILLPSQDGQPAIILFIGVIDCACLYTPMRPASPLAACGLGVRVSLQSLKQQLISDITANKGIATLLPALCHMARHLQGHGNLSLLSLLREVAVELSHIQPAPLQRIDKDQVQEIVRGGFGRFSPFIEP